MTQSSPTEGNTPQRPREYIGSVSDYCGISARVGIAFHADTGNFVGTTGHPPLDECFGKFAVAAGMCVRLICFEGMPENGDHLGRVGPVFCAIFNSLAQVSYRQESRSFLLPIDTEDGSTMRYSFQCGAVGNQVSNYCGNQLDWNGLDAVLTFSVAGAALLNERRSIRLKSRLEFILDRSARSPETRNAVYHAFQLIGEAVGYYWNPHERHYPSLVGL